MKLSQRYRKTRPVRQRYRKTRPVAAAAAVVLAAGLAFAGGTAASASPRPATPQARPQASSDPYPGQFNGTAIAPGGTAWAVGYEPGLALAERFNGKGWVDEPSLISAGDGDLYSVSATSAGNAWAVGYLANYTDINVPLIVHWNGKAWKRVVIPDGPTGLTLSGVTAVSASNVWAVGTTGAGAEILHWNGKSWSKVPTPDTGKSSALFGVAATSASNIWAVGDEDTGGTSSTLILHWNGKTWSRVPSPTGESAQLNAVTAASAGSAWAVGYRYVETVYNGISYSTEQTLILHWNGKSWATAASPNPHTSYGLWDDELNGVSATSASNAWAVGTEEIPGVSATSGSYTMILHWNGKTWARVSSPNPFCATCDSLTGVAASSAKNAWAVGTLNAGGEVVILHWNGTRWANATSANVLADT
jgi:hypothetical protein